MKIIKEIIAEKLTKQELFTVYDITKEARKKTKDSLYHNDVKIFVHDQFLNGLMVNYTRTLANFNNTPTQPWIYHPINKNVSEYSQPSIPDTTSADVYLVDSRKTLCIPAKKIKSQGLQPKDQVFVAANRSDNTILVTKTAVDNFEQLATYTVNHGFNVRIVQRTLSLGGNPGDKYSITEDNGMIVIKSV